jgi:ligand-binding sensor domain-containing protein/signal transduction histidine kinase
MVNIKAVAACVRFAVFLVSSNLSQRGRNIRKRLYIPRAGRKEFSMTRNTPAAAIGLLCWLLSALAAIANPGPRYCVDTWGTDEGQLPESSVISIVQGHDGYLWLGTENGLVRFDGVRFTVFDESNTRGLPSIQIVKLFEDSQTNLWVGTESAGAALIRNGRVTPINFGSGREGRLVGACEDSGGAVWLYTRDGDLGRYRNGTFNVWEDQSVKNQQSGRGCAITADRQGRVLVGDDHIFYAIDASRTGDSRDLVYSVPRQSVAKLDMLAASRRGGYWRLENGFVEKWSSNDVLESSWPYPWKTATTVLNVRSATEDASGNLIVGTSQGVFWFDPQGGTNHISSADGLTNESVLAVLPDNRGGMWVGLDGGGLSHVKPQRFKLLEGTSGWTVQSVCEDDSGGLWFSSNDSGIDYWRNGALTVKYMALGTMVGPVLFNPRAMMMDDRKRIWACTADGGLFTLQGDIFRRPPGGDDLGPGCFAIHQDRAGLVWVGTQEGLARWDEHEWKIFRTNDGLSANLVRAIADDSQSNLWVGTERGGLNRFREGRFTAYRQASGFPSDNISALYVDKDQVVWVGTMGSGLIRFHNDKWVPFTARDGLISDSIDYIVEDSQDCLWIGSNSGLMRLRKKALNDFAEGRLDFVPCRKYDRRDGLPNSECSFGSQPAAFVARDGRLWCPTIAGLVSVDPAKFITDTNQPPVIIESVRVEEKEQNAAGPNGPPPHEVRIHPGEERLDIQFTSLNLASPEREHFRYRLQNHETAWTIAPRDRTAHYPKLPPGDYRFEVQACNDDGAFGESSATLAVIVLPAFWQTGWFRGAVAACLVGLVAAIVYLVSTQRLQRQLEGMRQQQALEKERARIARDIHDQVGANLTQLSLLGEMIEVEKEDPCEIESCGRQISQTARETTRALDEIVWTVNPSNDTLDGLVTYLCKHAQDFLSMAGLRYRLEIPAQLPPMAISPEARHNVFLAAREAVTNVVRHAQATEVLIRLRLGEKNFALEIQDNGRGPGGMAGKTTRNGLRNMRSRMEDIGGRFEIEPAPAGGTIVRLTTPAL